MTVSEQKPYITGDHKAQLYSDTIHAVVVTIVVLAVTVLAETSIGLPPDVIGTVYGGAIGYAAGRAGAVPRHRDPEQGHVRAGE